MLDFYATNGVRLCDGENPILCHAFQDQNLGNDLRITFRLCALEYLEIVAIEAFLFRHRLAELAFYQSGNSRESICFKQCACTNYGINSSYDVFTEWSFVSAWVLPNRIRLTRTTIFQPRVPDQLRWQWVEEQTGYRVPDKVRHCLFEEPDWRVEGF